MQLCTGYQLQIALFKRVIIKVVGVSRYCGHLFCSIEQPAVSNAYAQVAAVLIEEIDHDRYLGVPEVYTVFGDDNRAVDIAIPGNIASSPLLAVQQLKTEGGVLTDLGVSYTTYVCTKFVIPGKIITIYLRKVASGNGTYRKHLGVTVLVILYLCSNTEAGKKHT